jgi:predicted thioesterase
MHPAEEVIGAVGLTEMIVRPGDTSLAIGIGDLPIIAPSLLINLMEHAAILSLDLFLEPEETTIPVSVEFISLSPASIGAELRGTSRVIEIDGKEYSVDLKDVEKIEY